jgi:plasmid stability protein
VAGIAARSAEDLARAVLNLMLAKPAYTAKLEAAGRLQRIELQPERLATGAVIRCRLEERRVEMERRERHGRISEKEWAGLSF